MGGLQGLLLQEALPDYPCFRIPKAAALPCHMSQFFLSCLHMGSDEPLEGRTVYCTLRGTVAWWSSVGLGGWVGLNPGPNLNLLSPPVHNAPPVTISFGPGLTSGGKAPLTLAHPPPAVKVPYGA